MATRDGIAYYRAVQAIIDNTDLLHGSLDVYTSKRKRKNPSVSWEKSKDARKKLELNRKLKEFNSTIKDYYRIKKDQNNKCAICKTDKIYKRGLAIDHCHKTNKFRGLLCFPCNAKLGWYEKRKDKIVHYLNK